jgi:hypothetical protein
MTIKKNDIIPTRGELKMKAINPKTSRIFSKEICNTLNLKADDL